MEPWYKVATPRKEVREGRSFNPDEFAIALEQVVAGTAPDDYRDPDQFFARTCFTRALREHAGNGAASAFRQDRKHRPGAHAHHAVRRRQDPYAHHAVPPRQQRRRALSATPASPNSCSEAASPSPPKAKVAVFVGQRVGSRARVARRHGSTSRASSRGIRASRSSEALRRPRHPAPRRSRRVFEAAGAPVLLLFDEVLNFLNRHRDRARIVPRLHSEPDGRYDRHDAWRLRDQPSAQPGRNDARGTRSGRTRSPRWCAASPRT